MVAGKGAQQQTGRKFALLIGVWEFGEGFKPLHTPENALNQFNTILVDPAIGGFPANHVTTLANPSGDEMRTTISEFFSNCRSEDVALLYFIGHGVKNETAEAIADITSTGSTLRANHLKVLEDGLILRSQATLYRARGVELSPQDRAARDALLKKLGAD